MIRTRVGYAGGRTPDPTYRNIGDHTECIQVDYDPTRLTYEELLQAFWTMHSPSSPAYSTQYASLVLAHDEEQLREAEVSRDQLERLLGKPILTDIRPLDRFYVAEHYHQKHALRGDRTLLAEFRAFYPDDIALRESTAAARVNGYRYGIGTPASLGREIDRYGLTDSGAAYLRSIVETHR